MSLAGGGICFFAVDPPLLFLADPVVFFGDLVDVLLFLLADRVVDFLDDDVPVLFFAAEPLFLVLDFFAAVLEGSAFLRGGSLSPGPVSEVGLG